MVRPRTVTDEQLLAAAARVAGRRGPRFTLAEVADEAHVVAGTVTHRFGSRHGLLLAMGDAAVAAVRARTADTAGTGPYAAVRLLVRHFAPLGDPATAPHHLALLAADLADEQLRAKAAALHAALESAVAAVLRHTAVALPGAPPAAVGARVLVAATDGTAMHWACAPHGRFADRLSTDLHAIVRPWRRAPTDIEGDEHGA